MVILESMCLRSLAGGRAIFRPSSPGEKFGFLVEHHEHQEAGAALLEAGAHFLVAQQVVVHVLDGFEFVGAVFARHDDLGMGAIEAVEKIDVFELVDPAAEAQNVVRGGRQEGDGRLVLPEVGVDFRQACEFCFFCGFSQNCSPQHLSGSKLSLNHGIRKAVGAHRPVIYLLGARLAPVQAALQIRLPRRFPGSAQRGRAFFPASHRCRGLASHRR